MSRWRGPARKSCLHLKDAALCLRAFDASTGPEAIIYENEAPVRTDHLQGTLRELLFMRSHFAELSDMIALGRLPHRPDAQDVAMCNYRKDNTSIWDDGECMPQNLVRTDAAQIACSRGRRVIVDIVQTRPEQLFNRCGASNRTGSASTFTVRRTRRCGTGRSRRTRRWSTPGSLALISASCPSHSAMQRATSRPPRPSSWTRPVGSRPSRTSNSG
eukprot:SAG11_NODE_969_length_6347_cov_13.010871_3_plen_216_part_00